MRRRQQTFILESRIPRDDMRLVRVHEPEYTALNFLADISMFLLTGGLWIIWIFVREMRRR